MRRRVMAGRMLAVAACSASAMGCSSSPGAIAFIGDSGSTDATSAVSPSVVPQCDAGGLQVAFNPMYSAYDGVHMFQVPAVVVGSNESVVWSADSSMVGMQSDPERPNEVLITMLNSGTTTIEVQSADGKCATAQLIITAATPQEWDIGNARYYDGKSLVLNGAAGGTGSPLEQAGGGPACNNCHGETATSEPFTDVSHTPEQTGGFSNQDLLNIILNGEFPDGGYFDTSIVSYMGWHQFHQWRDITADGGEQAGIVTFLRSLPPAPQDGRANFAAFDSGSGSTPVDSGAETGSGATGEVDAASESGTTSGVPEAGVTDAGGPDANANDAATTDASELDATVDSAASDSAASDAEPDAGD